MDNMVGKGVTDTINSMVGKGFINATGCRDGKGGYMLWIAWLARVQKMPYITECVAVEQTPQENPLYRVIASYKLNIKMLISLPFQFWTNFPSPPLLVEAVDRMELLRVSQL